MAHIYTLKNTFFWSNCNPYRDCTFVLSCALISCSIVLRKLKFAGLRSWSSGARCSTRWPASKTGEIGRDMRFEAEIGDAKVAILKGVLAEEAESGDFGQNGTLDSPRF